jgi:Bacterial Ig domain/Bacterial Ig-like domain
MFRFASAVAAVTTVLVIIATTRAHGADCTTTVSSLSAVAGAVNDQPAGSTVCLADGTYGKLSLSATKQSPGVTVRAEHPGQATIAGASLQGSYLTLAQFNVTDEIDLMPGSTGMAVDHNRISGGYMGVNLPTSTTQVNDARITGNKFVGPFGEDAIRANRYHDANGDGVGLLVEGNEITGVRENGNHSDCLQAVWVGDHMVYRRNYLHDNRCQGFFIKDQQSTVDTVVAEDNLMVRNDAPCAANAAGCGEPSVFQLFGPMTNLTVRRNTIWTPGGGSPTTLRDGGWGSVRFDSNVISRPWSDTSAPYGSNYSATNNVSQSAPEGTWPATGFSTAAPAFKNAAADDYRTNDGRGVDWAPADQLYGPGAATTTPSPPPGDTTPPDTTITSGPSDPTTSTSASFAFTSSESGSTFECKLDDGAYAACTSPKSYSGLGAGPHTFTVRAKDAAGNTDTTPATKTWTIDGPSDTTAPDTTITAGPSGPTNDTTPTFAFTASQGGSTFACRVDSASWAACTSPWTTSALTSGNHSVSVRATDPAGNTDASPATRAFSIDTTPPKTTITSAPPAQTDSGDASVAFTVSESGSMSECRPDGGAWSPCTSPYKVTGLAPGAHSVGVRSTDPAGNVESPGASASWTVGSQGPGEPPPAADAPPSVDLTAPAVGSIVSGRFRIVADAEDDHSIDHVEFWVGQTRIDRDDQEPYSDRADASRWSTGIHTISVRAFDGAGQSASSAETIRVSRYSRTSTRSSSGGWAELSSTAGDGVTRLSGQAVRGSDVRVSLTPCGSSRGTVVDQFTLHADQNGRLEMTYAGANRCVLRLDPLTG